MDKNDFPPRVSSGLTRERSDRLRPARRGLLKASIGAVLLGAALPSFAQAAYPERPIRLVLGFPPGGATDNSARLLAQKMGQLLGQPIVVENKPGASGSIAAEHVARSAPDGYTIFYTTSTVHGINPNVYAKLPYDPVADFEPIIYGSRTTLVVLTRNDLGAGSVAELIEIARSRPGGLSYASAGLGSTQHLAGAMFARQAGIEALHVPYRGSSLALNDLMSGQVDFSIDTISASLPFIRNGQIRALAVTSLESAAALPELPTVDSQGLQGFQVAAWGGLVAPRGVPAEIVRKLNAVANEALKSPEVMQRIAETGGEPQGGPPERFGQWIKDELGRWKLAVDAAGAAQR
ncbi:MAG TPA: tripartite tricarboxylate transporter substrate binding protein [Burkholderiaceae bacterium]|nr:tripartite tricarboxylate transporter substrate binding protein [Burkholderiaceae bacterium]